MLEMFLQRWRLICAALLLLAGLVAGLAPTSARQSAAPVYVAPVQGSIDLGLAPYLARVFDEAQQNGAQAVLLDINTPGGRLDAALQL